MRGLFDLRTTRQSSGEWSAVREAQASIVETSGSFAHAVMHVFVQAPLSIPGFAPHAIPHCCATSAPLPAAASPVGLASNALAVGGGALFFGSSLLQATSRSAPMMRSEAFTRRSYTESSRWAYRCPPAP